MADVFISYARNDFKAAANAAGALGASEHSVWYDADLPAHRAYSDVIAEQLDSAGAVLVLWSAHSVASQWVRSEANRARESGRLVQARLDDCALPMPFDQIQCADLRGWSGKRRAAGWLAVERSLTDLVGTELTKTPVEAKPNVDRRALLAGGLAVVAAGTGFWWMSRTPPLTPEAQLLLSKGMDALQANDALDPEDEGTTAQAIALLTEATKAAPQSAMAWGGLALAYAARRRASASSERSGLKARGEEAAREALRRDPQEPRGLAAQRIMAPLYRNWLSAERADRAVLQLNPTFPILLFVLSDMLGSVGRYREATELSNRLNRTRFLLPGAERKAIVNLWSSGNLQAADEALEVASARFPRHRQIWRTKLAYLLYSGRPGDAIAMLDDDNLLPIDVPRDVVEVARATANGLAGSADPADAASRNLAFLKSNPRFVHPVAQAVAALGQVAPALSILEGYFLDEGPWAGIARNHADERSTSQLFQPPMQGLWREPGFTSLLRRIGLEDYWRQSGSIPDFRRHA